MACSEAAGAAADGVCGPTLDGSGCDDGVFCNGADTCASGACTGAHTGDPCAVNVGDADSDCSESCDEVANACSAADPNTSVCNDGLFCTGADTCMAGACVPGTDPCAGRAGDADTDCSESCNEAADDCTAYDPEGSSCDDGLYCSGAETCASGVCVSAGDPCPSVGDGDADCSESCDEVTHLCTANDPAGATCDDGLFCTMGETCAAGACGGSAVDPCAANVGDADTDCSESCDEASDACTANDPDSSACDDGMFCNGAETCTAGACGDSSGDPCIANVGDSDEDCSESCHEGDDACEANDPSGSVCDDGLACNGGDRCIAGSCAAHALDECPAVDEDAGTPPDAGREPDAGGGTAGSRAGSGGGAATGRDSGSGEEDAGDRDGGGAGPGESEDGCGCRIVSGAKRPSLSLGLLLACLVGVTLRLRRRRSASATAAGSR
jgi:hypothetical protein